MQPSPNHPCKDCKWLSIKARGIYPQHRCDKFWKAAYTKCLDYTKKREELKEGDR